MSYRYEKGTEDLIIEGFEKGVGTSPHEGFGNLQSVNIATESNEVLCSYSRVQQSQQGTTSPTGTILPVDSSHVSISLTGVTSVNGGIWINISASTITGLTTGDRYILSSVGGGSSIQLATAYNGSALSGFGASGSATFTLKRSMSLPIASATEIYSTGSAIKYRYYVLDNQSLVWVYDTNVSTTGVTWFLPDFDVTTVGSNVSGIAVLNGNLLVFAGNKIWFKATVNLGDTTSTSTTWIAYSGGLMVSPSNSPNPHFAFVGHQGKCYYTDGNFLGSIFPNTSLLSGVVNIQSYASYTAVTTTGTLSVLIGGSLPQTIPNARIPAIFFTSAGGTLPAALSAGTVFWIDYNISAGTFNVYAASSGGSPLDIATGSVGTQYFNTFYPISSGGNSLITFTPQRFNLPFYETAQCMAELGNTVIVSCKSNVMYPWDQVSVTPSDLIPLPENNVSKLVTVGSMVYAFAGAKGNIYITNGSSASLVFKVPDYCAGIAGTPASYIEPYFTWGDAMYLRGRVYFSILDQTATKTGNCGGIWSFIPTQNFYIGQDTGLALRLENKSSYGTLNGVCTVLIPAQDQGAISPQFWSAWYSSISSPTYGIDFTNTQLTTAVIETDLIPTGTMLDKKTFQQIEFKFSQPFATDDAVTLSYRQSGTDSYTAITTTAVKDATNPLSLYFPVDFEKGQWIQLFISMIPSANTSFMRLYQIRLR